MSIGQVIKVVREERGLTQSQFAHELFVTQQALSRWEKGTADPSIDMIRLISTRFEVPMARLMEMPDNGFLPKLRHAVLSPGRPWHRTGWNAKRRLLQLLL